VFDVTLKTIRDRRKREREKENEIVTIK